MMPSEETNKKELQPEEALRQQVAELVRVKSRDGQFTSRTEIRQYLLDRQMLPSQPKEGEPDQFQPLLVKTLEENGDLKELSGKDGVPRYYSSVYMTDSYVRLLLRKEGDPLSMIAETVRENSLVYPRPLPLTTFSHSPFDLTQEEISACLRQMTDREEYTDIQQTTTSIGTVYLYSTLHLDRDYASMLAEWLEVGQFNNP
jgi:hypothetical protein